MSNRWIKVACSIIFLVALLWFVDVRSVWARLQAADMTWIALALVAITAATLSMARRWQIVAQSFGIDLSYARAVREYYLAQLVNLAVPGGVVGDVTRAVRTRDAVDLKRSAQSVIVERLVGQIYLLGLMFGGFVFILLMPGEVHWAALGWLVPLTLAVLALATWKVSRGSSATGRLLHTTLGLLPRFSMLVHGAVTTFGLIFGFYASARAIGVVVPPEAWATLIPLVLCAMLIPLSIAGWGWREGAAAALFPMIGAPASAGVASGITYGLLLMIAVLPAAFILIAQSLPQNVFSKRKPNQS